jgi:hypothetical protein
VVPVTRNPSLGFPGGPPNPPFGSPRRRKQSSTGEVAPEPEGATDDAQPADQVNDPADASKLSWKSAVASFVATAVGIAAVAAFVSSRGADEVATSPTSVPTLDTTVAPPETTPPPPPTEPAAPSNPGAEVFASVPVVECNDILQPIGAFNAFTSGTLHTAGDQPQLEGTGGLGQPVWRVELNDAIQVAELIADPPSPGIALRGVVDGHLILFAPYSPASDSDFAVYRGDSGDLIWSGRIPAGVRVVADEQRLYLVDTRDPAVSTLAIIAPGRATVVGCHKASGSNTPRPSVEDGTLLAADGRIFVALPASNRVQVIADDVQLGMIGFGDVVPALHAAVASEDGQVLFASNRRQGDAFRLVGVPLVESSTGVEMGATFELTAEALTAAASPAGWDDPMGPTGALLRSMPPTGQDFVRSASGDAELRGVLADTTGVYVNIADADSTTLVSVAVDGTVRWAAPAPGLVASMWRASNGVLHLADVPPPNAGYGPSVVFVDGATGASMGKLTDARATPGVGSDLLAYPYNPMAESGFAGVIAGAGTVGAVVGSADFVAPLAASNELVVFYVEAAARRYLLAFVLDPQAIANAEVVS